MERLRSVARAAAMQSRQLWLPVVGDPVAPSSLADREGAARAEPEGPPPGPGTRLVLVGPEGGWAAGECETIRATVGLGPSVLRADTAAVVAGALLTALRAGVVAPRS
jgi:16S rRNA (uracil1498-N3)-methyltransferase